GWRDCSVIRSHNLDPAAIRSEPRPAGTTQCEDRRIRLDDDASVRAGKNETTVIVPARPLVTHFKPDAGGVETLGPRTQQRRRFHRGRKHPTARADERRLTKPFAPRTQHGRLKHFDAMSQPHLCSAV